jgi:hypothetical protein
MPGLTSFTAHQWRLPVCIRTDVLAGTLLVIAMLFPWLSASAVDGSTKIDCPPLPTFWMGEYEPVPLGMWWKYRNEKSPYGIAERSVFEALLYEGHPAVKIGQPGEYQVVGNTGLVYTIYASSDYGPPVDLPQDVVVGEITDGSVYGACAVAPCDTNLIRDWDAIDPTLRAQFALEAQCDLDARYDDLVLVAVYNRGLPKNSKNVVVESNLSACAAHPAGAVTQMVWLQRGLGAVAASDITAATGNIYDFYTLYAASGVDDQPGLRAALMLEQNTPNPFNPQTTIKFDLPEGGPVRLSVFDVAGRLIRTLVDASMPQGSYETTWDGRDSAGREVASGSYLARLEFDSRIETVRMGLIR